MEGIFAVNKPAGITSHTVVSIVRRATGVKRVGHGGTLDPFAIGVLVIAVGRENTKKLSQFVKGEKEYEAEIMLGKVSTTDDPDGEITEKEVKNIPELTEIKTAVASFIGTILQTPPIYSSLKINGKPAHRRVRNGEEVVLKPRQIEIRSIEILSYKYPILNLKITTGPGVYIRAIARDLGEKLGTGGYLTALKRIRVNTFTIDQAINIEDLKQQNQAL